MNNLFDYDIGDIYSIVSYAKKLKGKTFKQIVNEYNNNPYKNYTEYAEYSYYITGNSISSDQHYDLIREENIQYNVQPYNPNYNSKGALGTIIEKCYFGYNPNSNQEADFSSAGLELKVTTVDVTKDGYRAGERLSITNISYTQPVIEDFYSSHVWNKIRNILLIDYVRDKTVTKDNCVIQFVYLYSPSAEDLKIIVSDYYYIINKIKSGKAHELHEGDTNYLGSCTKGAKSETNFRNQYYGDHTPAQKRNFCFRQPYMNYILHEYVIKDNEECDRIIDSYDALRNDTLDQIVLKRIRRFQGKSDSELSTQFNVKPEKNKSLWVTLTFRMLGIKSNDAEEFKKAGIKVKTIRVEEDNTVNEHWELPPVDFMELINEDWYESKLRSTLIDNRWLIVVFKKHGLHYYLYDATLYSFDDYVVDTGIREEWLGVQNVIKEGVKFTIRGKRVFNNIPNPSVTNYIHMRPHANKSAYKFDNYSRGNIKNDAKMLPNGDYMTTQSFWINVKYFSKVIIQDIFHLYTE